MFTLEEIIKITHANVLKNEAENECFTVSTDTRSIEEGQIYLPLKGENFDGENFIPQAIEKGARAYFTTGDMILGSADVVLQVGDCLRAYMELAKAYKEKVNPITIEITGSSGKTTVKEMMYSVMSEAFETHKTEKNYNNEIGFCKTVLSMPKTCQVLILETGMRGFGEIDLLAGFAKPNIGLITNIGTAHIGRLGSRENIARAKCEIVPHIKPDGIFIAPNDELIKKITDKGVFISLDDASIVKRELGYTKFIYKNHEYELNIEGDYNVQNALGVIEAGLFLNIPEEKIAQGLRKFKPIEKRWDMETVKGYKVINDSYNANPDSMLAVIRTVLQNYPRPLVFVLGDMGELGKDEIFYHRQIGEYLADKEFDKVITVGTLTKEITDEINKKSVRSVNFLTNEEAAKYILDNVPSGTTIVLKASRAMKFEQIVEILKG